MTVKIKILIPKKSILKVDFEWASENAAFELSMMFINLWKDFSDTAMWPELVVCVKVFKNDAILLMTVWLKWAHSHLSKLHSYSSFIKQESYPFFSFVNLAQQYCFQSEILTRKFSSILKQSTWWHLVSGWNFQLCIVFVDLCLRLKTLIFFKVSERSCISWPTVFDALLRYFNWNLKWYEDSCSDESAIQFCS